jgi:hypothetical protein
MILAAVLSQQRVGNQVEATTLGCSPEEAAQKPFIASMGIYVFKRKALLDLLKADPEANDFGGEIIPKAASSGAAALYPPALQHLVTSHCSIGHQCFDQTIFNWQVATTLCSQMRRRVHIIVLFSQSIV